MILARAHLMCVWDRKYVGGHYEYALDSQHE